MNIKKPFILSLFSCYLFLSCNTTPEKKTPLAPKIQKTTFNIEVVYPTENYFEKIENSIQSLPGIEHIEIDQEENLVEVTYNAAILSLENIATSVTTLEKGHSLKVYNMEIVPK